MNNLLLAAACNSEEVLSHNLARSPLIRDSKIAFYPVWGATSAASAYNQVLDNSDAPIVVFAHQDVFLPAGWESLLEARIREVERHDPNWALLGAFGVSDAGAGIGPVWSSSLGMIVGRVPTVPIKVQSFDELLIVLRRSSGIRFDEGLTGWHMYGTDIVQIANTQSQSAYACGLPCIHNDGFHGKLGADFDSCYRFIQRKWRARLPIQTPITKISWHGLHLLRDRWNNRKSEGFRRSMTVDTTLAPTYLAECCGWANLGQVE